MNYSGQGLGMTARFEGFRSKAYQDQGGVWTIGYGRTVGVKEGDETTEPAEREALEQAILRIVAQINRDLKVRVTQGEFDALVDFAYNLGLYAEEHSTLWAKLQAGDFAGAAAEFPRWAHCNGVQVQGLLTRRLAEQAEFLNKGGM